MVVISGTVLALSALAVGGAGVTAGTLLSGSSKKEAKQETNTISNTYQTTNQVQTFSFESGSTTGDVNAFQTTKNTSSTEQTVDPLLDQTSKSASAIPSILIIGGLIVGGYIVYKKVL